MKYLLVLLLTLLGGCFLDKKDHSERTPGGWRVQYVDQGTLSGGFHTKAELYALFDGAMARSVEECALKVGLPSGYVVSKLRDLDGIYHLVDNFYFAVPDPASVVDVPGALYASGMTVSKRETWVAFYCKSEDSPKLPSEVDPARPWTVKASTTFPGMIYWAEEYDGRQYPALGYELHWQFSSAP